MKITNETHWSTADVKRLILRVAQDELDRGQLKHAKVFLKYQRKGQRQMGECAFYGTPRNPAVYITLLLPREGPIDLRAYALIIAHEFAHAKGHRHREMNKNNRYYWLEGWEDRYSYALLFSIKTTVKEVSREARIAQRRQVAVTHSHDMVTKWERAAKRADTALKKWRVRLKAAERRVVTLPPKKPPQSDPLKTKTPSLSMTASAS